MSHRNRRGHPSASSHRFDVVQVLARIRVRIMNPVEALAFNADRTWRRGHQTPKDKKTKQPAIHRVKRIMLLFCMITRKLQPAGHKNLNHGGGVAALGQIPHTREMRSDY